MRERGPTHGSEAGYVTLFGPLIVLPLFMIGGAMLMFMRTNGQLSARMAGDERALQAAEAAIDRAIYESNLGTLADGSPIDGTLGSGVSWSMEPVAMATDGRDNDGDGDFDETDEDGFEVTATGRWRNHVRRVVAYVRPRAKLPGVNAAVSIVDPAAVLEINGNAFTMDGNDHAIDGSPGTNPPLYGVTVNPPGTEASLLSSVTAAQESRIGGLGGAPSAAVVATDLDAAYASLQAVADNRIAGANYTSIADFGDAATEQWRITHCAGNLQLSGNMNGAGVLLVDGDLEISGNVAYVGMVLVRGNIRFSGGGSSKLIRGALMVGGDALVGDPFTLSGTVDLQYSSQAVQKVQALVRRAALVGWREIARS